MQSVYLDTAATSKYTLIDDIIVDAMTSAMKEYWRNPSSLYATDVKDKIDECRATIAKFIGAEPNEIYFTSGASESNNWAIKGWHECNKDSCLITTFLEHKSVSQCVDSINTSVIYCDNDKYGMLDLDDLERCMKFIYPEPILVSVCMANNEVGIVQNAQKISEIVHKYAGTLHLDATQALGHIPINVKKLGVDMMSCSGHKISPVLKGIGFLYKRNGIDIKPLIYGSQEQGLRGGTENTFGIIGLSKAIEYCDVGFDALEEMIGKRDYLIGKLQTKFGCKLNGHNEYRLPNNVNVTFPQNITGEALLYTLDLSGIHISTGSACNSLMIEPSHVLKAIGLTDEEAMRTVRFTLSEDTTFSDINYVIDEIAKAIKLIES